MYPVLFRIGHFSVATYGVFLGLAVAAGGMVLARGFQDRGLSRDDAWALLTYTLAGGILGAKLYYVILQGNPAALLSRSGLVWYGGLLGGAAAVGWAIRRKRLPLGATADALAPATAVGHAIGHIGCFFSGDSYGVPSSLPWAVAFPRGAPPSTAGNLRGVFDLRLPPNFPDDALLRVHPTMLYSAIVLLAVAGFLWWYRRRSGRPGRLFALYLLLAGTERFLVEFLRAKDDRVLWGLTTAQVVAVLLIVAGGVLLAMLTRPRRRTVAGSSIGAEAVATPLSVRG